MTKTHFITLAIIVVAYIAGARYPSLARKIGAA